MSDEQVQGPGDSWRTINLVFGDNGQVLWQNAIRQDGPGVQRALTKAEVALLLIQVSALILMEYAQREGQELSPIVAAPPGFRVPENPVLN